MSVASWNAPAHGVFSFEEDRKKVSKVFREALWKKLQQLLRRRDLPSFRFLLNIHKDLGLHGLIPGISRQQETSDDPEEAVVERFLSENLFDSISQRDSEGWSPFCYAAMGGDAFLVKSLLKKRADANDRLAKKSHAFPSRLPVLSIAVSYKNAEVTEVLLAARANVHTRCGYGGTALHWAAVSDCSAAVQLFIEARADVRAEMPPGLNPLRMACGHGSLQAFQELLVHHPNSDLATKPLPMANMF